MIRVSFSLSDIDPMIVTPAEPQVVMLGDDVEWQCKTKASAAHTVQWKKVCTHCAVFIALSSSVHIIISKNVNSKAAILICYK